MEIFIFVSEFTLCHSISLPPSLGCANPHPFDIFAKYKQSVLQNNIIENKKIQLF